MMTMAPLCDMMVPLLNQKGKAMVSYIGVDVETTGLEESEHDIIELGIVLLNESLQPIKSFSSVIKPEDVDKTIEKMSEYVYDMHMDTGLINELEEAPSLSSVEKMACDFLVDNDAVGLPLVGSSITLDRNFIREHLPTLYGLIHYQSIDATSLRIAANTTGCSNSDIYGWSDSYFEMMFENSDEDFIGKEHRVIYDILKSISLIKASIALISAPPF